MAEVMLQVGVDRMMFSTDYPYQSMAPATAFLDSLPVSPQDRERVAHGNAENLLHILGWREMCGSVIVLKLLAQVQGSTAE